MRSYSICPLRLQEPPLLSVLQFHLTRDLLSQRLFQNFGLFSSNLETTILFMEEINRRRRETESVLEYRVRHIECLIDQLDGVDQLLVNRQASNLVLYS